MSENEYNYQDFIWKDLAERILKEGEDDTPEEVNDLASKLENEFDDQVSEEAFTAAEKWLDGFDAIMPELDGVEMAEDGKSTLVFSILGANLLTMLCESLEVNIERVTIGQRQQATKYLREYTKILMWMGGNRDQLKKDVPSVE